MRKQQDISIISLDPALTRDASVNKSVEKTVNIKDFLMKQRDSMIELSRMGSLEKLPYGKSRA